MSTAIDEGNPLASMAGALEVADLFGLSQDLARGIAAEVTRATDRWREVARATKLGRTEIDRMRPAFEHQQREIARELASPR